MVTYWVDMTWGWSVVVNVPSGMGEGAPVVAAGCGAALEKLGSTDIVASAGGVVFEEPAQWKVREFLEVSDLDFAWQRDMAQ